MVAVLEKLLDKKDHHTEIKGVFIASDCDKERLHLLEDYLNTNCHNVKPQEKAQTHLDRDIIGMKVVACGQSEVMVLKDIQRMLTDELTSHHFIDSLLETRRSMRLPLIVTGNDYAKELLSHHEQFMEDFIFLQCS